MVHTTTPSVRLWYQKITSVKDIGKFVQNLYQEDVARVGGGHISAKTAYLKTKGNKLGVVVLFDPNRVVMTYGNGKWKISANKRMVDFAMNVLEDPSNDDYILCIALAAATRCAVD